MGKHQRIVISDPTTKKDPVKPAFYLTPTQEDTINIHYTPLDSDGEMYYHGSLASSDTQDIDTCISLVVSAMQGKITDKDTFAIDMSTIGLEKKVTKKDREPADVVKKEKKKSKKVSV